MEALTTTAKFGATAQHVIKRIDELIRRRKLDANRKTVVVMATNQGTLDLVANFACSCRAGPPDVQRALASTLVFTGDSETSKQVELFGLASFHDSALGDLPEGAAKAYGDYAFVRMMCVCGVLLRASSRRFLRINGVDAAPSTTPLPRRHRTRRRRDAVDASFHAGGSRSRPCIRWSRRAATRSSRTRTSCGCATRSSNFLRLLMIKWTASSWTMERAVRDILHCIRIAASILSEITCGRSSSCTAC